MNECNVLCYLTKAYDVFINTKNAVAEDTIHDTESADDGTKVTAKGQTLIRNKKSNNVYFVKKVNTKNHEVIGASELKDLKDAGKLDKYLDRAKSPKEKIADKQDKKAQFAQLQKDKKAAKLLVSKPNDPQVREYVRKRIEQKVVDSGQEVFHRTLFGKTYVVGQDPQGTRSVYDWDGKSYGWEQFRDVLRDRRRIEQKLNNIHKIDLYIGSLEKVDESKLAALQQDKVVTYEFLTDSAEVKNKLTRSYPVVDHDGRKLIVDGRFKGHYLEDMINRAGRQVAGTGYVLDARGYARPMKYKGEDGATAFRVEHEPYVTQNDDGTMHVVLPGWDKAGRKAMKEIGKTFKNVRSVGENSYSMTAEEFDMVNEALGGLAMSESASKVVTDAINERKQLEEDANNRTFAHVTTSSIPGMVTTFEDGSPRDFMAHQKKAIDITCRKGNGVIGLDTGCHAKGTLLRTFSGTDIAVEDLHTGDSLLGPDGTIRWVLSTVQGHGQMVRVSIDGVDSFVVNEDHILVVAREINNWVSVSAKSYMLSECDEYQAVVYGDDQKVTLKSFTLESLEDDDYYGITLDSDHLYVMSNGVITHNTGKTPTAVGIMMTWRSDGTLRRDGKNGKALFVVPPSLKGNFPRQIREWVTDGDDVMKDVEIMSYTAYMKHMETDEGQAMVQDFGCVFFDEAQALRTGKSKVSRMAMKMDHPRKIALTASILEKTPIDLYNLISIANNDSSKTQEERQADRNRFIATFCDKLGTKVIGLKEDPTTKAKFAAWVRKNTMFIDKAQPLSAKILTPTGWSTMGEIHPGDSVMCPDGTRATVLQEFERGIQDVYTVEMSDGSVTECCLDHLWLTRNIYERGNQTPWKVRDLRTILKNYKCNDESIRTYQIPLIGAVDFETSYVLPIEPYTLGALLGDGSINTDSIRIHTVDAGILSEITENLPECMSIRHQSGVSFSIVSDIKQNAILEGARILALDGVSVYDKFIPDAYFTASYAQRLALLQGLMDTDGSASALGTAVFATTSVRLKDGIVELVRSLGGVARVSGPTNNKYPYKGEVLIGADSYKVTVSLVHDDIFRLPRKQERMHQNTGKFQKRLIKTITLDRKEAVKCIMIDHPDHLYITDDYIVTHNTDVKEAWAQLPPITPRHERTKSVKMDGKTLEKYRAFSAPIQDTLNRMMAKYKDGELKTGDVNQELNRVMGQLATLKKFSNNPEDYVNADEMLGDLTSRFPESMFETVDAPVLASRSKDDEDDGDNDDDGDEKVNNRATTHLTIPKWDTMTRSQQTTVLDNMDELGYDVNAEGRVTIANPKTAYASNWMVDHMNADPSNRFITFTDDPDLAEKAGAKASREIPGKKHIVALSNKILVYKDGKVVDSYKRTSKLFNDAGERIPRDEWQAHCIAMFQKDPDVISYNLTKAYTTGHNIQTCNKILHLDRNSWNNENMKQREARAWRTGADRDRPIEVQTLDLVNDDGDSINEIERYSMNIEHELFTELITKSFGEENIKSNQQIADLASLVKNREALAYNLDPSVFNSGEIVNNSFDEARDPYSEPPSPPQYGDPVITAKTDEK